MLVGRIHVAVVKSRLLLMVQILVEWTLIRSIHLVHLVHVRVHLVHVMTVVSSVVVVLVASSMIVPVVEIPCQITVIFLVISRIAVTVGVRFDESESNSKDDVEAG